MFHRRKSTLIKKIWKFRRDSKLATPCKLDTFKALLYAALKCLSEDELQALLKSVQSKGGIDTPCLCPKKSESSGRHRLIDVKYVFGKAFVYPELETSQSLRTLHCCATRTEPSSSCVNPYHSSHVIDTECPLPPYAETDPDAHISDIQLSSSPLPSCGGISSSPFSSEGDILHELSEISLDDAFVSEVSDENPASTHHRLNRSVYQKVDRESPDGSHLQPLETVRPGALSIMDLEHSSRERLQNQEFYVETQDLSGANESQLARSLTPTKQMLNSSTESWSTSSGSSCSHSSTSCLVSRHDRSIPWCKIAYWEQRHRVGRLFEVREDSVNIFEDLPQGDGLCLALLEYQQPEVCKRVRKHIGYGFQLTREPDGVWLYNRSQYVLFAGSPTIQLESVERANPVVKRIPSGCSIKVYDPALVPELRARQSSARHTAVGVTESKLGSQLFSIRVSFAKGWGVKYTRMSITSCPCWVEIYLNDVYI